MKRQLKIVGGFLLGCLAAAVVIAGEPSAAPNTLTKEEAAAGWRLLFDGTTLKGWEAHMASATEPAATWGVANGAIFCEGNKRGWLGTDDMFADFNLKLEFRVGATVNSGVFLRSQKTGGIPAETGYELQIWDFRPTYKTGSLVNAIEAEPSKILADRWNTYDVSAEGDRFVVVLNGKRVLDGHDSKHRSGVLGLQYNVGGKVEFRNIKIRPIKH
jgi:hypothetical protein